MAAILSWGGTCVVNEICPRPVKIHWQLGDTRVHSVSKTTVVNSAYAIVSIQSTCIRGVVAVDDVDRNLMCVLVMQNAEEFRPNLHIDDIDEDRPVKKTGVYVSVYDNDNMNQLYILLLEACVASKC